MKHIHRLLIGLFLCIPLLTTAASPEITGLLGPAVLFDHSVISGEDRFTSEDLSFGIDGRFTAGIVSANILSYVCREACPEDGEGLRINTYVKAGAALDIAILRLGAYIGPRFGYVYRDDPSFDASLALRFSGDLHAGPFFVGVSYIIDSTVPLEELQVDTIVSSFDLSNGKISFSLLTPVF